MPLKIAACIKQVPVVEDVRFDHERRTLIRDGVPNQLNAFDRRALAQGTALRDEVGGEVVAVTMGPPQAEETLRGALSVGVDRAVHLSDPLLAGADTLATARTLAAYLKPENFDLVLCGQYSIDAETGQLGPELAALLGIPHATAVIALQREDDHLVITRETDEGLDTLRISLPCLLTTAERLIHPAPHPNAEMLAGVAHLPVEVLTAADLGLSREEVGLAGSPTWVADVGSMEVSRSPVVLDGDPAEASARLVELLRARGAFEPSATRVKDPLPAPVQNPRADRAVWVFAELVQDQVHSGTFEMLGAAARIATQVGGSVGAVLIGSDVTRHVPAMAAHGASVVYVADAPELAEYSAERYAAVLKQAVQQHAPWALLVGATAQGRDFAPRTAAELGLGLTGDAVGLELDADGNLVQMKPAFGGTIIASILCRTFPQMATVRPGMLPSPAPDPSRTAQVVRLDTSHLPASRTQILERQQNVGQFAMELDAADRVVCAGAGIGGPENLHYVHALAEALDAAVGATRKVTDRAWLPRQLQIGLTGKAIAAKLYVGVAVHGAVYHMVGLKRAETVVVINNDSRAPIFQQADFVVQGDYREVVPALVEALQRAGVTNKTPALV